jgi:twitching motility protein PilT
MAKIDAFFKYMMENDASDLHLSAGCKPKIRKHGELEEIKYHELTNDILEVLLFEIISDGQREKFLQKKDLDFAYEIPNVARFRANYFYQKRGLGAVFRIIPSKILSVEELNLPETVLKFTRLSRGLVLVTGPTGSGKSTTLAAMIDYININRKEHILTIEDPVEFVHKNKNCLVNQREVLTHTGSFSMALRAALREDPDVILVGEMRDLETIELALTAAETGHLVFGTLHTNSAAKTVDRCFSIRQASPD